MLERVLTYIERHQLLPVQGEIVVAVSGGADSLCLAYLLRAICGPGRRYPGVLLRAAHLNHLLRGEEGAHDARVVASMMQTWEIPLTVGEIDVISLARAEKRSLEEAARVARYGFLRKVANGARIAVAHHADDQVETLLLHWLRGTGLCGMVGMPPHQQDLIRPLLEITRAETIAYCVEHNIIPVEDQSNHDPRFLRNRIRHELIPLLRELNPGIQHTLLRNAEVARIDLEWLEKQVDQCWASVVLSEEEATMRLRAHSLLMLPLSIQRHLLRRVTARLCAGQSPLETRHLSLIERMLGEQSDRHERALHLPQHIHAHFTGGDLIFTRLSPETARPVVFSPEESEAFLAIPGEVRVPATPWLARAEVLPAGQALKISDALSRAARSEAQRLLGSDALQAVCIDGATLERQLLVRTRRAGDRIQPLGMTVEKRVQDLFIDRHVPRAERASIPLFFSNEHCLWVAGVCLDERVRLTGQTRSIVRLSIEHF